jgi:hypothetical protein
MIAALAGVFSGCTSAVGGFIRSPVGRAPGADGSPDVCAALLGRERSPRRKELVPRPAPGPAFGAASRPRSGVCALTGGVSEAAGPPTGGACAAADTAFDPLGGWIASG